MQEGRSLLALRAPTHRGEFINVRIKLSARDLCSRLLRSFLLVNKQYDHSESLFSVCPLCSSCPSFSLELRESSATGGGGGDPLKKGEKSVEKCSREEKEEASFLHAHTYSLYLSLSPFRSKGGKTLVRRRRREKSLLSLSLLSAYLDCE